jgi:hypothetical protein
VRVRHEAVRLPPSLAQIRPGSAARLSNALKCTVRQPIVLRSRDGEKHSQTDVNGRRSVTATYLVDVIAEPNHAGTRLGIDRLWSAVLLRRLARTVRVVTCAEPVMFEHKPRAWAEEQVGTNEGQLVVVHLNIHIIPHVRRARGQVGFNRGLVIGEGEHPRVLVIVNLVGMRVLNDHTGRVDVKAGVTHGGKGRWVVPRDR